MNPAPAIFPKPLAQPIRQGQAVGHLKAVFSEHRSLMLGVTAGVILHALVARPPQIATQLALLAAAVAVVGLPHGALDHLIGREIFRPRFGRSWWLPFGLLYLGLASLMASVWFFAPVPALVVFLALSAGHFGWDDPLWIDTGGRLWSGIERLSVGSLPIVLPTLLYPVEVTQIFGWMMAGRRPLDAGVIAALAGLAAAVVLPVAGIRFVLLLRSGSAARLASAELAAVALLHLVAPPLIAFLTYFCGWHSVRHALELADGLSPDNLKDGVQRFLTAAVPMTLAAAAGATAVAWILRLAAVPPVEVLSTVIFVGLSVLTVPHMAMMGLSRLSRGR